MTTERKYACSYMLYDMSNQEIIDALRQEGWSVDVRQDKTGDWLPAFVCSTIYDRYPNGWKFRITKGDRSYTCAVDLYPIASKAIYGDKVRT